MVAEFVLNSTTPLLNVELLLVVIGLGLGLFSSPNISSVMGSVPPERRGVASAIRATVFNAGNVISIGLVAYFVTTAMPCQIVSEIITFAGMLDSSLCRHELKAPIERISTSTGPSLE